MKIVFFGTTDYSARMLEALISAGHDISLVVTLPDRPSRRGHKPIPTPVAKLAQKEGLTLMKVKNMHNEDLVRRVKEADSDLGVVVAFKILPVEVFGAPRLGTINVHPSLLPELRGPAPVRWALIRGYKETGITTFRINENVDEGNLFLQERIRIGPDETYGELFERITESSADILIHTVNGLAAGTLQPKMQDDSMATKAPKITPENSRIDWTKSAKDIHNLVRAMNPKPGAWAKFRGETVRIYQTEVTESQGTPGEIIECNPKTGLTVACGDGAVKVLELQMPGKKAIDVCSFLCGCKIEEGELLR